jgi:hypothetical protein
MCGVVQLPHRSAGEHLANPSSCTSTASTSHTLHQQSGTPGPIPSAADTVDFSLAGALGFPMSTVCSNPGPGQDEPSEAPVPRSRGGKKKKNKIITSAQPDEERNPRVGASPGRRAGGNLRECARCAITAKLLEASGNGKLKECSGCRTVRYCGTPCQLADWPTHKATCKRLQAAQK